jgi:hypothetical protein
LDIPLARKQLGFFLRPAQFGEAHDFFILFSVFRERQMKRLPAAIPVLVYIEVEFTATLAYFYSHNSPTIHLQNTVYYCLKQVKHA